MGLPRISDAEWKVMKVLWARQVATTTDVVATLAEATDWKPKTIMTLLNRLTKKEAIGFRKKGRVYEYFPLVSQDVCIKDEAHSFLSRVYDGRLGQMLVGFLAEAPLSEQEIEELKRILDQGRVP